MRAQAGRQALFSDAHQFSMPLGLSLSLSRSLCMCVPLNNRPCNLQLWILRKAFKNAAPSTDSTASTQATGVSPSLLPFTSHFFPSFFSSPVLARSFSSLLFKFRHSLSLLALARLLFLPHKYSHMAGRHSLSLSLSLSLPHSLSHSTHKFTSTRATGSKSTRKVQTLLFLTLTLLLEQTHRTRASIVLRLRKYISFVAFSTVLTISVRRHENTSSTRDIIALSPQTRNFAIVINLNKGGGMENKKTLAEGANRGERGRIIATAATAATKH